MADGKKELMLLGALMLGLIALGVLTGVFFTVMDEFKESLCESNTGNTWDGVTCDNSSGVAQTISSITQVSNVETAGVTVIGFVGLVIIVLIGAVVVRIARQFQTN